MEESKFREVLERVREELRAISGKRAHGNLYIAIQDLIQIAILLNHRARSFEYQAETADQNFANLVYEIAGAITKASASKPIIGKKTPTQIMADQDLDEYFRSGKVIPMPVKLEKEPC